MEGRRLVQRITCRKLGRAGRESMFDAETNNFPTRRPPVIMTLVTIRLSTRFTSPRCPLFFKVL